VVTHYEDQADVDQCIGQRVRRLRLHRGLGLRACAELCGRTEEWLRQVERGEQRLDKLSTLVILAKVLGVRDLRLIMAERLDGLTCDVSESGRVSHKAVPSIRQVLSTPVFPARPVIDLSLEIRRMKRRLDLAWSEWHRSARPYTALGVVAPGLLRDALVLHRSAQPYERHETWTIIAEVFQISQRFLYCVGEPELAARAADRGMVAAEETGDPVLIATSAWMSTMAALGASQTEEACEVARTAAEYLKPALRVSETALSVWGSLQLFTAIAYAKGRRTADAWRHWDLAQRAASALGPVHHHPLTMFGKANVGVYAVAIEVETGRSAAAVDRAKSIAISSIPSSNRRAQHLIDLARGQLCRRAPDEALACLRMSEQHSTETIIFSPGARQAITEMIDGKRRPPSPLLDLALRARVIA
jgi:transcriptional regulator with XRE-family HTH domain